MGCSIARPWRLGGGCAGSGRALKLLVLLVLLVMPRRQLQLQERRKRDNLPHARRI